MPINIQTEQQLEDLIIFFFWFLLIPTHKDLQRHFYTKIFRIKCIYLFYVSQGTTVCVYLFIHLIFLVFTPGRSCLLHALIRYIIEDSLLLIRGIMTNKTCITVQKCNNVHHGKVQYQHFINYACNVIALVLYQSPNLHMPKLKCIEHTLVT